MPLWGRVVAAGLNQAPVTARTDGTTEAATETATGAPVNPFGGLVPGMGIGEFEAPEIEMPEMPEGMGMMGAGMAGVPPVTGGMPPMGFAGNGPIEEYGDSESNAALRALGCPIPLFGAPEEQYMVCMQQTLEADCKGCASLGCSWTPGAEAGTGTCGGGYGFGGLAAAAALKNTKPEEQQSEQSWPENVNPAYVLTLGVLAGALFGCGLGVIYSRCQSKQSSFEEAMIHLDAQV